MSSINNITRNNTIDEWRIQTNQSANALNTLETGNYVKSNGTLSLTANGSLIITANGTALQVSNAALFSTDVTVGKSILLGAAETAQGNLQMGGIASIYGPGTALYVANNVISNGSLVVKNTITTNNVTVNSNTVIVGTTNTGYLGVANSGTFGKYVTVGTTLDVTGNTTSGNLTTEGVTQSRVLRVDTTGLFGTDVTIYGKTDVTGNVAAGNLNSVAAVSGADLVIGSSGTIGTTLIVTGNTTAGNLTTSNATSTGSLKVLGSGTVGTTLTVTGNNAVGNLTTANMVYAGSLRTTGRADVGTLTATSIETIAGGDATVDGKLTVRGDFILSGDIVYDTDVLSISTITPISTTGAGYYGVFRGNTTGGITGANVNSLGTVSDANAYIRWSATANNWQVRDVFNKDGTTSYSKILTANLITISTSTTSNDTFASSWLMKNYVDNANTNMKNYVDTTASLPTQANTGSLRIDLTAEISNRSANVGALRIYTDTANTNMKNYVDTSASLPTQANTGAIRIDLTSEISNRQANVGSAIIQGQANVGAGIIAATLVYQANTGAGLITEVAARQANVGAGLISTTSTITSAYQANTGAGLITEVAARTANVGAGLITTLSAAQANSGAGIIAVTNAWQANTGAIRILADSKLASVTVSGVLGGSGTTGSPLTITQAGTGSSGYLSSSDFNTFSGKQNVLNAASAGGAGYMTQAYAQKLDGIAAGATNYTPAQNIFTYSSPTFGGLTINGNIYASQEITAWSDKRLKTSVETITNALALVNQMRGVMFDKDGRRGTGVIAQEMQEVLPEVVLETETDEKYLSVAYGNIVGVLIEAIKELKAEVDELKKNK